MGSDGAWGKKKRKKKNRKKRRCQQETEVRSRFSWSPSAIPKRVLRSSWETCPRKKRRNKTWMNTKMLETSKKKKK